MTKYYFNESIALTSPFDQFSEWFSTASKHQVIEINAAILSTSNQKGQPSSRIILIKEFNIDGFVFFTNYESQKGQDLQRNPKAALLFFWPCIKRQVRIQGNVEKISSKHSNDYFQSRPLESRISALASSQSKTVDLKNLQKKVKEIREIYIDNPPRPDYWGGYRLVPNLFEFWQEGKHRLHDRLVYSPKGRKNWKITRLSP